MEFKVGGEQIQGFVTRFVGNFVVLDCHVHPNPIFIGGDYFINDKFPYKFID